MQKSHNSLFFLIKIGDNRLSVVLSASCKHIDRVILTEIGQELETVRSHIELELISFVSEFDICFLVSEDRVDQSLVKIHNQKFLLWV